ncbi:LysM peptidoglycan-binding domain-containing protein [Wukongibacter baidiensis]|uniref:LysM peptidoglycan-binding domain-containing protein n=1 Tax=Wukongibacter baidiensis TaxID=1723361 RepID=UPI003D7F26FF
MRLKKLLLSTAIGIGMISGGLMVGHAQNLNYTVKAGETFWIISQSHNVDLNELMAINNADENTVLYVGQNILIPQENSESKIHIVKSGDTFWIISEKYGVDIYELMKINNATENTVLNIGDEVIIPNSSSNEDPQKYTVQSGDTYWIISQKLGVSLDDLLEVNNANENSMLLIGQEIIIPNSADNGDPDKPYISYESYTVQKGDDPWKIALKFGIPYSELLKVNNINENTMLNIGDTLKIPVYNIPVKETPGPEYGEYLDWWNEAQYVLPTNAVFKVIDFYTGKSFMVKRTTGANHADAETLTVEETNKMKEIWGGSLSWVRRPVIIEYNGRRIAASVSSMPHAGNDNAPGGLYTTWRSDDYGPGYNLDWVKGNGIDGVFDIHFLNSTRHKDGQIDSEHQENIKIAAGIK